MALPGGILGSFNYDVYGKEFTYNPKTANGTEPAVVIDNSVGNNMAFSAQRKGDPENVSLVVQCVPLRFNTFDVPTLALDVLQCELNFTTGSNRFGYNLTNVPVPVGTPRLQSPISNIVRFDANNVVNLPAVTGLQLNFRYVVEHGDIWNPGSPWVAGNVIGYPYDVNVGFSYGPPKVVGATLTDIPTLISYGPTAAPASHMATWGRPALVKSTRFSLVDYPFGGNPTLNVMGGWLDIEFRDVNNNCIAAYRYSAPFTVMPDIDWPGSAWYVRVNSTNLTGPVLTSALIRPIHTLLI